MSTGKGSKEKDTTLPSIGRPLAGWGSKCGAGKQSAAGSKVGLWSAVALQQHFRQQGAYAVVPGVVDAEGAPTVINTHELPPAQPHGRLTLAQKMGLVPAPPPAPTSDDWRATEARALLREKQAPINQNLCGICFEYFYATLDEAQVILSCSHVFHERCFKQFEQFVRQQLREEGADATARLACPECRQTHYFKKTYYAGKAMAQRSAIVRVQACVRGFLARRAYTKWRLQHNQAFRESYATTRLAKLSRAWDTFLDKQAAQREAVLSNLDAVKQAAAAAYLTEEDWQTIIAHRVEQDRSVMAAEEDVPKPATTTSTSTTTTTTSPSTSIFTSYARREAFQKMKDLGLVYHECPICLEWIERKEETKAGTGRQAFAGGDNNTVAATADDDEEADPVAELRREYERKRDEKNKAEKEAKQGATKFAKEPPHAAKRGGGTNSRSKSSATKTQKKRTGRRASTTSPTPQATTKTDLTTGSERGGGGRGASEGAASRLGIILSCGHVFHGACLRTFERYSEWRNLKEYDNHEAPANGQTAGFVCKCPLCRAGYAKHDF